MSVADEVLGRIRRRVRADRRDSLCQVEVDTDGRLLDVTFSDEIARATPEELTSAMLGAYVAAAADAAPDPDADDPPRAAEPPLAEADPAELLEQVTGTADHPLVTVTLTASGRLRRIGFQPAATSCPPEELRATVRAAVDQAAADAADAADAAAADQTPLELLGRA